MTTKTETRKNSIHGGLGMSRADAAKATLSSSFGAMLEDVRRKARELNLWNDDMQRDLPKRWEKHGDMIVFPQNSFQHENWRLIGRELWAIVAAALGVERLGRKRLIANDEDRSPHVDILYGLHGWVEHSDDSGFNYVYDASVKVFEIGRLKEMSRIAQIDAHGETVVNLMAGLGYYTFPWVARAGAKHVHAVEWDEVIAEAIVRTASANGLDDSVSVHLGDARRQAPVGIADRVYVALLPSSKAFWMTACKCLKDKGGFLHIQEAVDLNRARIDAAAARPGAQPKVDENANTKKAPKLERKLSRSASIVEEMENRVLPPPTIEAEFAESKWKKIEQHIQGFALDLAEHCCRYMNNVNVADGIYSVEILNVIILKPRSASKSTDLVVVDLQTRFIPNVRQRRERRQSPDAVDENEEHSEEPAEDLPPRRRRNWEEEIMKQIEEEDRAAREAGSK